MKHFRFGRYASLTEGTEESAFYLRSFEIEVDSNKHITIKMKLL